MRYLGTIVRLQIQERSLKVGQGVAQRYDPAPLRCVPILSLTEGGVWGWSDDGERLADVHHRDHPESKNRGENGVSVGFTGHYAAMRDRFGDHLPDGIAGENILVESGQRVEEADLAGGLLIERAASGGVLLEEVIVAAPCAPFSRYALRFPADTRPDATVTDALRFLNDGMRGYYARYRGDEVSVAIGDRVYAV